jgi:hypothetical protein
MNRLNPDDFEELLGLETTELSAFADVGIPEERLAAKVSIDGFWFGRADIDELITFLTNVKEQLK